MYNTYAYNGLSIFLTSGHQGEQKQQKENVTFHSLGTFKDSECKRETKCPCGVVSHYAPKYKYMFIQLQSTQSPARANLHSAMTVFCFFSFLTLHNGIMGSAMLCL